MRKALGAALISALALTSGGFAVGGTAAVAQSDSGTATDYIVVYTRGAAVASSRAAIKAAGGTITREHTAIGVASVRTTNATFSKDVRATGAVSGAAANRKIGKAPATDAASAKAVRDAVEKENQAGDPTINSRPPSHSNAAVSNPLAEPLSDRQWDMRMIDATPTGSYAVQPGSKAVRVGIIDTGVDGNHPDIKPNFSFGLSRNFTTDDPLIDGACATDPDGSCSDPAWVDEDGHGTHVASTIGSPINDLGIAGVAPNVTLINVRAGQDSGYFFLEPTINALMYSADIGIDVVNMSFYIDPWLYNCPTSAPAMWNSDPSDPNSPMVPADSAAEQLEQQTIITATNLALDYAHAHGVTLIGAAGNEHTNMGAATKVDLTSPDYPPGTEHPRVVTNACLDMPTEGNNVLSISSVGPSGRKADYSNYGMEQITVAAPGGWYRDGLGTKSFRTDENLILAAYPEAVARANGEITKGGGVPNNPAVVRDCAQANGGCAYYQYIQGTSMATPHAVGVAALIISEFGTADASGLTMSPDAVAAKLMDSAVPHACPPGGVEDYTLVGRTYTATCTGTTEFNDFYGHGIVNALNAVQ
ncbi:MAG: S8 family serine peptidase [Mycobacteriales bacterium]